MSPGREPQDNTDDVGSDVGVAVDGALCVPAGVLPGEDVEPEEGEATGEALRLTPTDLVAVALQVLGPMEVARGVLEKPEGSVTLQESV